VPRDYPHSIEFSFDKDAAKLDIIAEVPVGTWCSFGFGSTMIDTDMVVMQAFENKADSSAADLWSKGNTTPTFDDSDDLKGVTIEEDSERGF
jgi:hypothetical protein